MHWIVTQAWYVVALVVLAFAGLYTAMVVYIARAVAETFGVLDEPDVYERNALPTMDEFTERARAHDLEQKRRARQFADDPDAA